MSIQSRVLTSGIANPLLATSICGDSANALTAAGTDAGTAFKITAVWSRFTTVAAGTGARLPTTEPDMSGMVINDGAHDLTLYPASGSTIDGTASVTVAVGKRRFWVGTSTTIVSTLLGA